MAGTDIGAVLRAVRRQKRLSLVDVAKRSGTSSRRRRSERTSAVSERFRVRLQRLAVVYGVDPEDLFRKGYVGGDVIDLREDAMSQVSVPRRLILDFSRLTDAHGPFAMGLMRFATAIAALRRSPASLPLTVRSTGAILLAAILGSRRTSSSSTSGSLDAHAAPRPETAIPAGIR